VTILWPRRFSTTLPKIATLRLHLWSFLRKVIITSFDHNTDYYSSNYSYNCQLSVDLYVVSWEGVKSGGRACQRCDFTERCTSLSKLRNKNWSILLTPEHLKLRGITHANFSLWLLVARWHVVWRVGVQKWLFLWPQTVRSLFIKSSIVSRSQSSFKVSNRAVIRKVPTSLCQDLCTVLAHTHIDVITFHTLPDYKMYDLWSIIHPILMILSICYWM
jgi:hypothetical protein